MARKHGHKPPEQNLAQPVGTTPGEEGKRCAAAKDHGLYTAALACTSPCDPKTPARAHVATQPAFAVEAGDAALDGLVRGCGYEVATADVWMAYSSMLQGAEALGSVPETHERVRSLAQSRRGVVSEVLSRELSSARRAPSPSRGRRPEPDGNVRFPGRTRWRGGSFAPYPSPVAVTP